MADKIAIVREDLEGKKGWGELTVVSTQLYTILKGVSPLSIPSYLYLFHMRESPPFLQLCSAIQTTFSEHIAEKGEVVVVIIDDDGSLTYHQVSLSH